MGVGKNYHPELDMKQKIQDIRADWEEREAARVASDTESASFDDDDSEFTQQVDNYFRGKVAPVSKTEKNGSTSKASAPASRASETTAASDQSPNEKQPGPDDISPSSTS